VKNWTFNKEIQILLEQFTAAFNDIIIKRFDNTGNTIPPLSGSKVNFVYAPKQRLFNTLLNPSPGGITLPAIGISISGISRDTNRVVNKLSGFSVDTFTGKALDDTKKAYKQPIPININLNMSIVTRYQTDMDQIISNFAPYCDPYIVISWKLPGSKGKDYEIRTEILWSGSVNLNYPENLSPTQPFRIVADTSFVIKGWLFKKTNEFYKKIYIINSDFTAIGEEQEEWDYDLLQDIDNLLPTDTESLSTNSISFSARPQIRYITPSNIYLQNLTQSIVKEIEIYGESFLNIENVYLSASNPNIFYQPVSYYNPFSSTNLETYYPPIYNSVEILSADYSYDQSNMLLRLPTLNIDLPLSSYPIYIDVILSNEAGYGKMTQDILNKKNNFNNTFNSNSFYKGTSGLAVYNISQFSVINNPLLSLNGELLVTVLGDNLIQIG
jgi:hypothetical protein